MTDMEDQSKEGIVEMEMRDWIPVGEGLPGANVDVLVSVQDIDEGGHVFIGIDCILDEVDGLVWGTYHRAKERVLAWMPMPPAYQPKQKKDPLSQMDDGIKIFEVLGYGGQTFRPGDNVVVVLDNDKEVRGTIEQYGDLWTDGSIEDGVEIGGCCIALADIKSISRLVEIGV